MIRKNNWLIPNYIMIINDETWFFPFILYFTFVRIKTNFTADLYLNAIII